MAPALVRAGAQPRICFVTTDFVAVIRNGGIGTHFWLLSRVLAERGWDVHVLFCGGVDDELAMRDMPGLMAAEGITFTWLEDLPKPPWVDIASYGDGDHTLLLSQRALEALKQLHSQDHFDIIEFPDWGALGFRAVQAKRAGSALTNAALAVKLHSTTDWQRRGNLAHRKSAWELKTEWCERYAFEHADIQLSPSHYMVADTRDAGWHVRDDVIVAYPFPGPEEASVVQSKSVRELVFFGRLERRKGLDVFLAALERLPVELPVLFLGRDTFVDGRRATEMIRERMGARPYRVEAELDRTAALATLRVEGRLAVIASQSETFGFTVAECVANQIPFIAARVGGIPEVLRHSVASERWLFEPTVTGLTAVLEERLRADEAEECNLRREAAAASDHESWNNDVERSYREAAEVAKAKSDPPALDEPPTVSVAVTHYNHGEYLPAALASLAAQTRPPDEVFVIDDGSTDAASRRVFERERQAYPQWTFLSQDNTGPGSARNRCLGLAAGRFFLPFDSDNIATPHLVESLVAAAKKNSGQAATACQALAFIDESDIDAGTFAFRYAPTGGPRILAGVENLFGDTCALFQSAALRAVGGFETERTSPHEDWETMTKLAFGGYDIDVVPAPLFYYRTVAAGRLQSLTADPAHAYQLRQRMVRRFLADVKLERDERVALWECLIAFAQPSEEVARLQLMHDEVAEWAQQALADANAWHDQHLADANAWHEQHLAEHDAWREAQLEDTRAFLQGKLDEAWSRAEVAERELRSSRTPIVPLRDLWAQTLSRTARGGRSRMKRALQRWPST